MLVLVRELGCVSLRVAPFKCCAKSVTTRQVIPSPLTPLPFHNASLLLLLNSLWSFYWNSTRKKKTIAYVSWIYRSDCFEKNNFLHSVGLSLHTKYGINCGCAMLNHHMKSSETHTQTETILSSYTTTIMQLCF